MTPAGRAAAAHPDATDGARSGAGDLVAVVAARAVTIAVVWALGFRAISDDDYSRVVIAQGFAAVPALDPSGTSWLPLPFWLTGAVMSVAGPSLAVARSVALLTALGSALLVHAAARALGLDRGAALLAGLLGAALPYAARLGIATVPDGYAAALVTFGAATAAHARVRLRVVGALAVTAAALCRYEAWPVALAVALFAGVDAARRRSPGLVATALVALVGPLAWLGHGALAHGDPFFFVGRVAAYRAALGASAASPATAVATLLVALPRYEPELLALAALALVSLLVAGAPLGASRYARFASALGALVAFVAAGEWRNAAPTHHAERALLAIWLGLAIAAGDGLARAWRQGSSPARWRLAVAAALLVAFATAAWRPRWGRPSPFADRRHEVGVGAAARRLVPAGERLVIDTPDYGFFAVMAAFGRPGAAAPLDDRDPRHPRPPDVFRSPDALAVRLRAAGARWLVTTTDRAPAAAALGVERARDGALALYEITAVR